MASSAIDPLYNNWVKQIKNDKLESICLEFKASLRDEIKAFKCFIHINQLVYKAVKENKRCKSKVEIIYQMSDVCCSVISSSWCCDTEIFLRCLFHIVNYFIIQGCLNEAKMLCTYIFSLVKAKPMLAKNSEKCPLHDIICVLAQDVKRWNDDMFTFESERGITLQEWCSFIICLIKLCPSCVYISKYVTLLVTVSQRCSLISAVNKEELLHFQLESLKSVASCEIGFRDTDIAFPIFFNLLYSILRNIIHLDLIIEEGPVLQYNIECLQQMFYKKEHKESFTLCSNLIEIFVIQFDCSLLINECNLLLLKWLDGSNYPICPSVVSFIKLFFINLRSLKTLPISNPAQYRLDSKLKLILNFVRLVEKNENLKTKSGDKNQFTEEYALSVVQCVYSVLFITYKNGNLNDEMLKECFDSALSAHSECLQWLIKMGKMKYKSTEYVITLFLTGTVNISSAYINSGKFEESLCFIVPAYKYLLMLPKGIQNYSDIERFEDCILKCIGRSYQKIGQIENALLAFVAWISCYPSSMTKVFSMWEEVKEKEVSENLSANVDTTVYDIITVKSEELAEKWCICNFTKSQQEEMLLKELSIYNNNRLLRGQHVFGVFSALQIITTDPIILTKGLIMTMDIASSDENYLSQSAELLEYSKIVMKRLKRKNDNLLDLEVSQCEFYCLLGNLTYHQFRCELQSTRNTSETEIVKITIQPRKPLVNIEPGTEVNEHDACDVMPAYSCLSLKKMMALLAHLFNAYDYWIQAYKQMKEKPDFDLSSTFENMKEAGVQLKLFCAGTKEEQLWNLLYDMAYVADRSDICVLAVAELLDIQEVVSQLKIEYASSVVSKPGTDENLKFTFFIQRATKFLSDNKISNGLKLIATLKKDMKAGLHVHLRAKFLLILSLYCRTPGIDIKLLNDSVSPSVSLYKALSVLLSVIQNKGWRNFYELCQTHLLLLRVSHEMGQFYWEQHRVREARCFIKPELSLAQKLVLPLRTAQLLILLAWVDLICINTSDCNVKLDGLEKILDIQSTGSSVTSSLGSPIFVTRKFNGPEFIHHLAGCTCFACTNLNYQHLVLEAITLRAHFCTLNGDMGAAMEYFRVGSVIKEKLCKDKEVLPQFIVVSLARFSLYYTDFFCASNKLKDARILNLKTQDLLKSVGCRGTLIKTCVVEQYIFIQHLNIKKETLRHFKVNQVPGKQAMTDSCIKTPSKYPEKVTIIKTPLRKYNGPTTPFARPPPIPFRLDMNVEESEKENTPSPAVKVQRQTRAPPRLTVDQHRKLKSRAVRKL